MKKALPFGTYTNARDGNEEKAPSIKCILCGKRASRLIQCNDIDSLPFCVSCSSKMKDADFLDAVETQMLNQLIDPTQEEKAKRWRAI